MFSISPPRRDVCESDVMLNEFIRNTCMIVRSIFHYSYLAFNELLTLKHVEMLEKVTFGDPNSITGKQHASISIEKSLTRTSWHGKTSNGLEKTGSLNKSKGFNPILNLFV